MSNSGMVVMIKSPYSGDIDRNNHLPNLNV